MTWTGSLEPKKGRGNLVQIEYLVIIEWPVIHKATVYLGQ